jgi:hypothetical protein
MTSSPPAFGRLWLLRWRWRRRRCLDDPPVGPRPLSVARGRAEAGNERIAVPCWVERLAACLTYLGNAGVLLRRHDCTSLWGLPRTAILLRSLLLPPRGSLRQGGDEWRQCVPWQHHDPAPAHTEWMAQASAGRGRSRTPIARKLMPPRLDAGWIDDQPPCSAGQSGSRNGGA